MDKRRDCIEQLEARFSERENPERVKFERGDANDLIQKICRDHPWKGTMNRAVVFLDPFGNQVSWETVCAIANTEAMDLWYLFPAGCGVFRQIGNDGTVDPTHEPSITKLYGTEAWKEAFFEPSTQGNLFDGPQKFDKVVTPESAAEFMIQRMKTVFKGGVLEERIPLGKHDYPSFYLLFAWGNPSEKASNLARKLAGHAIKASDREENGRLIGN